MVDHSRLVKWKAHKDGHQHSGRVDREDRAQPGPHRMRCVPRLARHSPALSGTQSSAQRGTVQRSAGQRPRGKIVMLGGRVLVHDGAGLNADAEAQARAGAVAQGIEPDSTITT